jgi:hypothetical protein
MVYYHLVESFSGKYTHRFESRQQLSRKEFETIQSAASTLPSRWEATVRAEGGAPMAYTLSDGSTYE